MNGGRPPGHPVWCEHDGSVLGLHKSRSLTVGDRYRGRGEVTAWLERGGGGPTTLAVNVTYMASATGGIGLDEARRLRDHLDVLIRMAENDGRRSPASE